MQELVQLFVQFQDEQAIRIDAVLEQRLREDTGAAAKLDDLGRAARQLLDHQARKLPARQRQRRRASGLRSHWRKNVSASGCETVSVRVVS